jgi:hypothetical protein
MDYTTVASEFLRPLVASWLNKIELSAKGARAEWKECADECLLFYNRSAKAMWDPLLSKKFWTGVKLPKFRVAINKAFEMVAIYTPNLIWEIPHRTVEARRKPMDQDMLNLVANGMGPQMDPQVAQMVMQQLGQQEMQSLQRDKALEYLLGRWLNYTPSEQPGGGLVEHNRRSVVDSLTTGRGVLAPRPYRMPGSGRNLTGAFRISPFRIYLDPDFDSLDECRWMAIKHVDVHTDVEERFELPRNTLKGRSTLESSWHYGEHTTDDGSGAHRKAGKTNDLVVWYEVFSKAGVGVCSTNMDSIMREHLDRVVGKYAYIAVTADVPYPLNMPSEAIRKGADDEAVRRAFSWPIPFWADDRFPVEFNDFYIDPESAWPVSPLSPGLGELKLLNFLVSWFANRTWSSSRDFWAVAQPHIDHYRDYILNGEDQTIIPTPVGLKSPKEAIEILTQPEMRHDMSALIQFVSDMFDRRVGLTATVYGQDEGGTKDRTAEATIVRQKAVMARPEYMQKQVVDWQSRVAASEAFVARWFVTGEDVQQLLSPAGRILWEQVVMSSDIEDVVRQFQYTVSAASIRRPNRDRDIGNFQQVMQLFAPVAAQHGARTNDYGAFNAMKNKWAELHDADLDGMDLPGPPPPEEQQAQKQIQQRLQMTGVAEAESKAAKLQAEAQKAMAEARAIPAELQLEMTQQGSQMALEQIRQKTEQIRQQGEITRQQIDQQTRVQQAGIDMIQDAQRHEQDMRQDAEKHAQDLRQKKEMAAVKTKGPQR